MALGKSLFVFAKPSLETIVLWDTEMDVGEGKKRKIDGLRLSEFRLPIITLILAVPVTGEITVKSSNNSQTLYKSRQTQRQTYIMDGQTDRPLRRVRPIGKCDRNCISGARLLRRKEQKLPEW